LSRLELRARWVFAFAAFALTALPGCWEQWSETWFPQMKWQQAVQAFESTNYAGKTNAFMPPDGAVPVSGSEPAYGRMDVAVLDALKNPRDRADLKSLENGKKQYTIFCATCHGDTGMGNGPVSASHAGKPGPFAGVFPLVGLTTGRSDGYLYNVIRVGNGGVPGFRMPSYQRIASRDRWDIVNYVRYLDSKKGMP
jgi:mono/diheme cytochrome c family protein